MLNKYYVTLLTIVLLCMAVSIGSSQTHETDMAWKLCSISPWVEADAQQLPAMLTNETSSISISGPRNDWLTGAIAISAARDSSVTVSMFEPAKLKGKVKLKVVGQVTEREQLRTVWDPLLSEEDIKQFAPELVNYNQVKDFPLLHVTPDVPAFLWLTVDLRGVQSGEYKGKLVFRDENGKSREASLNIRVLDAELPIESPLHCIAWQWANTDDMIRDFLEHGIDVTYRDHEKWWKLGSRFLLFQFSSTFHRQALDEKNKLAIKKELDDIYALIKKLKVPKDKWALYIADEPSDSTAKIDSQNAAYIRKLYPGTPIYTNPAWGILADKNQNSATLDGTMKVLNPYTNVWCPYIWHMWDNTGVYKYLKSTKKPLWFYEIYTQAANRRPSIGRDALRMLAWNAWRYEAQGIGMFSANDVANHWWRDLDPKSNGYANYAFTYPGTKGIMSSRAFEALRQGIQEHKRLYVLKNMKVNRSVLDALADTAFIAAGQQNGAVAIDAIRQNLDSMLVERSKKQN